MIGWMSGTTLKDLRALVGREVRYQGLRCTLVDILEDPAIAVLRPLGADPVIQADNYGQPMRHAPQIYELPVFAADGHTLSAELQLISVPGTDPPAGD